MFSRLKNLYGDASWRAKDKMIKLETKQILFYFIKSGIYVFCTWLFVYLMRDVWFKYSSKITSNGMRFRSDNATARPLHCFTIHDISGFKVRGFYYTNEMIKANSFKLEEFFGDTSLQMLRNASSMLTVKEHYSIFFGTCFTVCMDKPLAPR